MLLKLSVDSRGILERHCDRNKRILVTHKEHVTKEKLAQLGSFFFAGVHQDLDCSKHTGGKLTF